MKGFDKKQFLLSVVAVFIVMQATDFLIHGVILRSSYEATKEIWRPEMENMMWIMQITGIVFSVFFVNIYIFFAKGHFREGIFSGLCYGFLMGVLIYGGVNFNQYVIYNIELSLVWKWFVFGVIQMALMGLVTSLIYKVNTKTPQN